MNTHNLSLSVAHALLCSESTSESGVATPRSQRTEPRSPFTITISREVGALGNTVASEVGRRLGWPVYDRSIVEKVAEEICRPAFQLEAFDERPVNWLEDCLTALSNRFKVNGDVYLKYLIGTVRGLGKVGHCLIVGRGASAILPPETTLRVRLVANLPDRVRVIARRRGVPECEAAAWAENTDAERSRFVKQRFGQNVTDPHLYDLILNTSRLSVEECAELVIATLRMKEGWERPASREQVLVAGGG